MGISVVLATGSAQLDAAVEEQLKGFAEVAAKVSEKEWLPAVVGQERPDAVVLTRLLKGRGELADIVAFLRAAHPGMAIVALAGGSEDIGELEKRGVKKVALGAGAKELREAIAQKRAE